MGIQDGEIRFALVKIIDGPVYLKVSKTRNLFNTKRRIQGLAMLRDKIHQSTSRVLPFRVSLMRIASTRFVHQSMTKISSFIVRGHAKSMSLSVGGRGFVERVTSIV